MTRFTEHGHLEDTHHTYAYRKRPLDDYKPPEIGPPWNTSSRFHSTSLYKGGKRKASKNWEKHYFISTTNRDRKRDRREHSVVCKGKSVLEEEECANGLERYGWITAADGPDIYMYVCCEYCIRPDVSVVSERDNMR